MQEFASAIDQICEEKGIAKEKVLETIEMAVAAAYKKDHGLRGLSVRAVFDEKSGGFDIYQSKLVVDPEMVRIAEGEEEEPEEEETSRLATVDEEELDEEDKKLRYNEEKHIFLADAQKLTFAAQKEGVRKIEEKEEKHQIFIVADGTKKAAKSQIKGKKAGVALGDEIWFVRPSQQDYGRIAAQTAKQVVIQRIREAERESVYEEFKGKEGEVIPAVVQRIERGVVFLDIGKTSGVMFPEDQIQGEFYRLGQRLRVYVLAVQKEAKGPGIVVSRARPEMITRLFEIEVPEIVAGTVEIKSVAREAGSRSKIAVVSADEDVDPIGACVGQRGTRVQAVINELSGEKIDIIAWSADSERFIASALSPAKVIDVTVDKKEKSARVQVPPDQLSLAIGKQGQNVRLAAKLTGWKIDILTETGEKVEPAKETPAAKKPEKTDKPKEPKTIKSEKKKTAKVKAQQETPAAEKEKATKKIAKKKAAKKEGEKEIAEEKEVKLAEEKKETKK